MSIIFIHNGFRTSRTYLLLKFRENERFYAYCEPFYEELSYLNSSNIYHYSYDKWQSRHPVCEPYFLEFLPILSNTIGVNNFKRDFAFGRFIPDTGLNGRLSYDECVYVLSLLQLARTFDRIPVLGCTRTLGRVQALRTEFGGIHIMLHRPLVDQWLSFVYFKDTVSPYFVTTIWQTIHLNSTRLPFFRHVVERHMGGDVRSVEEFLDLAEHRQFTLFLALHLYLCAIASVRCDVVVDVGRLYADPRYRSSISDNILAKTGAALNFDDVVREVQVKELDYPGSAVTEIENDVIDFLFKEGYSAAVPFVLDQTREVRADLALLKSSARFWRTKISDSRPEE